MSKRFLLLISFLFYSLSAVADVPVPWQTGFQEPVTPIMHRFVDFHNGLLYMVFGVTIFVVLLLLYVCIKFSAKNNPNPSKTSHNTLIEIIWTVAPVIILLVIAIPSMRVLYFNETIEDAEMTLKVIGKQWYWTYEYPDHGNFTFDSYMVKDENLKEGDLRLLSVDNQVVLPVNTTIRLQTTGGDVIHNWAMPSFGTKMDAIPGRLNEGWIRVEKKGTYYGQCSELCGTGHGFMPISVKVVSKYEFNNWVRFAKREYANNDSSEIASLNK